MQRALHFLRVCWSTAVLLWMPGRFVMISLALLGMLSTTLMVTTTQAMIGAGFDDVSMPRPAVSFDVGDGLPRLPYDMVLSNADAVSDDPDAVISLDLDADGRLVADIAISSIEDNSIDLASTRTADAFFTNLFLRGERRMMERATTFAALEAIRELRRLAAEAEVHDDWTWKPIDTFVDGLPGRPWATVPEGSIFNSQSEAETIGMRAHYTTGNAWISVFIASALAMFLMDGRGRGHMESLLVTRIGPLHAVVAALMVLALSIMSTTTIVAAAGAFFPSYFGVPYPASFLLVLERLAPVGGCILVCAPVLLPIMIYVMETQPTVPRASFAILGVSTALGVALSIPMILRDDSILVWLGASAPVLARDGWVVGPLAALAHWAAWLPVLGPMISLSNGVLVSPAGIGSLLATFVLGAVLIVWISRRRGRAMLVGHQ